MTEHTEQPTGPPPPSDPFPSTIADDVEHRFDPNSITVTRLAGGIWGAAFAGVSLVGVSLFVFLGPLGSLVGLGLFTVWVAVMVLIATWVWFGPALRFKHASYRVNERGIQVRGGIFFRSAVDVPRSRVQHTDVSQGPLQRSFGLATLIIHTAGTQHASVPVSGLPLDVANRIRDLLIEGGQDDAV